MAKVKTKMTIDSFRAIQQTPHLIPTPRIVQIDEGFPIKKHDMIPEDPLLPHPSELFITQFNQKINSSISSQAD